MLAVHCSIDLALIIGLANIQFDIWGICSCDRAVPQSSAADAPVFLSIQIAGLTVTGTAFDSLLLLWPQQSHALGHLLFVRSGLGHAEM